MTRKDKAIPPTGWYIYAHVRHMLGYRNQNPLSFSTCFMQAFEDEPTVRRDAKKSIWPAAASGLHKT